MRCSVTLQVTALSCNQLPADVPTMTRQVACYRYNLILWIQGPILTLFNASVILCCLPLWSDSECSQPCQLLQSRPSTALVAMVLQLVTPQLRGQGRTL